MSEHDPREKVMAAFAIGLYGCVFAVIASLALRACWWIFTTEVFG